MARIAGHSFPATKQALVDRVYDYNHSAGSLLYRGIVRVLFPIAKNFAAVAIRAVVAQGRGKESHRFHELVDRNTFEHLDVLEDILCQEWFLLRSGLAARRQQAGQQAHEARS
jgi:hypothetical protein